MGKFKQMQIDIDDDYVASIEDPCPSHESDEEDDNLKLWGIMALASGNKKLAKTDVLCEHKAKLAFTRKVFVTYCEHCGKIFDVVKR